MQTEQNYVNNYVNNLFKDGSRLDTTLLELFLGILLIVVGQDGEGGYEGRGGQAEGVCEIQTGVEAKINAKLWTDN